MKSTIQPVANEPSLGTPHPTSDTNRSATPVVNTGVNTAGTWSAAVTMTGVPAGAKAAYCYASILGAGGAFGRLRVEAATGYTLSDIRTGTNFHKYHGISSDEASGARMAGIIKVHLDSAGQFKWCTHVTNSEVIIGSAIDYDM